MSVNTVWYRLAFYWELWYSNNMKDYNKQRKDKLLKSLDLEDGRDPIYMVKKESNKYLSYILAVVFFTAVMLFNTLFMFVRVQGTSMNPTLQSNQMVLVSKSEKPERFDIVVLRERLTDGGESKDIIKRIIGLPGDVVAVIDGELYVNNVKYEEEYLSDKYTTSFKNYDFTIVVPKDHVFVSKDSRSVGSFKKSAIIGVMIGEKK